MNINSSNGYSKMRRPSSRSTDFSSPAAAAGLSFSSSSSSPPPVGPSVLQDHPPAADHRKPLGLGHDGAAAGAAVLKRNCSSSSASRRFKADKEEASSGNATNTTLMPGVVRRAFSLRIKSSSSVGDGYCRIHGDAAPESDIREEHEDEFAVGGEEEMGTEKKEKKRGKSTLITRAWKRLFNLKN